METPTTPEKMTGALIPRPNSTPTTESATRQRAKIEAHFRELGSLSTLEARNQLGIMHPAARVQELREAGHRIITVWTRQTDATGRASCRAVPLARHGGGAGMSVYKDSIADAPESDAPAQDPAPIRLPLSGLTIDTAIQQRAGMDEALVTEYAADIGAWISQAPIDVFADTDGNRYVADGFHRVRASVAAGLTDIQARQHRGTRRDALLFAVGANRAHGLRRTAADKRRAVETLLNDPEWSQWSDRRIADQAGVSHPTVATVRASLQLVNFTSCPDPTPDADPTNCGISAVEPPAPIEGDPDPAPTGPDASPVTTAAPERARAPAQADKPDQTPIKRTGKDGRSRSMPAAKSPASTATPKPAAPTAKDAMHAAHAVTAALASLERVSAALLPDDCATLVAHLEQALARYRPMVGQGADQA